MEQADCATCDGLQSQQVTTRERRSSPREAVDSLVYVDLQPNNGGILLDLNTKGMRISAAHPLRMAKAVRFSIGLHPSATIEGTGRVTWITDSGKSAGILFLDLPDSSLSQIIQWLGSTSSEKATDPNEAGQTLEETAETGIAAGSRETPGHAQPASPPLASVTPATLLDDEKQTDLSETDFAPGDSEDEQPAFPTAKTAGGNSFPTISEGESETCAPPPSLSVHTNSHPSEREEIPAIRESSRETPEYLASATGTFHNMFHQDFPVSAPQQDMPISLAGDPAQASPETTALAVADARGLNDRLPVYTLRVNSYSAPSVPHLASQVLFQQLRDFGWGLERDWHVRLGTLFLIGGLVALWQKPPLLLLGLAFWIAGGLFLTDRKQPAQDRENSDYDPYAGGD